MQHTHSIDILDSIETEARYLYSLREKKRREEGEKKAFFFIPHPQRMSIAIATLLPNPPINSEVVLVI